LGTEKLDTNRIDGPAAGAKTDVTRKGQDGAGPDPGETDCKNKIAGTTRPLKMQSKACLPAPGSAGD
jgi:hypothetical protein